MNTVRRHHTLQRLDLFVQWLATKVMPNGRDGRPQVIRGGA
jgi:hypothetical protein